MRLSKELAKIFEEAAEKIFNKEIGDSNYLSHDAFMNSEDRADAAVNIATKRIKKIVAIMFCNHRAKEHSDENSEELKMLNSSISLSSAEKEMMKGDWWNA